MQSTMTHLEKGRDTTMNPGHPAGDFMTGNSSLTENRSRQEPQPRRIALLAFNDAEILDVTGPLDVFAMTNRVFNLKGMKDRQAYTVEVLAEEPGPVTTMSGLRIIADRAYRDVGPGIDTLLVAGGLGVDAMLDNVPALNWLRAMVPGVRRLGSICSGAFVLAKGGLLDGRRATTHWLYCQHLAKDYPAVIVEPDRIFVRDGSIYTSGGITSGIDLALAMVEEDWGRETALEVARVLVMFLKRPGGQSQFSFFLTTEARGRMDLRRLQAWIAEHPAEDLQVEALAERMAMSPRNFARVFVNETGMTPAKFVEAARINAARRQLEDTRWPIDRVAERSGFGNPERMRRAFLRELGVNPHDYRARFNKFNGHSENIDEDSAAFERA